MDNREDILVKVEGLGKKFCKDLKKSLLYGIQDVTREVLGKPSKEVLRPHEFWAVDNINFELKRGECLGLIGHNGAGKSTLLKVLNGLIKPDKGSVVMHGRVAALIELGAGFNPILTGRENIYNNAAVLGFSKKEVDLKLEDIIDFSEIREFIDAPVQSYSSGMKVRLGFAVAAQMEPDVLIIDEVLAVGDLGFRVKCLNRISELLRDCAVIFVSHAMPQVGKICNKAILMHHGKIACQSNNVSEVMDQYFLEFDSEARITLGNDKAKLIECSLGKNSNNINDKFVISKNDLVQVDFKVFFESSYHSVLFNFSVWDKQQKDILLFSSFEEGVELYNVNGNVEGNFTFINQLANGIYTFRLDIREVAQDGTIGELILSDRNIFELISQGAKYPSGLITIMNSNWNIYPSTK